MCVYLNLCLPLVFSVPRNHDRNTILGIDFDIELGNTADEAKDDPGKQIAFDRENLSAETCMMTDTSHWRGADVFGQEPTRDVCMALLKNHSLDIAFLEFTAV